MLGMLLMERMEVVVPLRMKLVIEYQSRLLAGAPGIHCRIPFPQCLLSIEGQVGRQRHCQRSL